MSTKFQYHKDGTLPQNGEIFVFGSNLAGRHGAGAALEAAARFGAMAFVGEGRQGQSYAIPTKTRFLKPLPLLRIELHVALFIEYTNLRMYENFFITRVGCGLAGFTDAQIAPMFRECNSNCSFAEEWAQYLEG